MKDLHNVVALVSHSRLQDCGKVEREIKHYVH